MVVPVLPVEAVEAVAVGEGFAVAGEAPLLTAVVKHEALAVKNI